MAKNLLILGGTGIIGSAISKIAISKGFDVYTTEKSNPKAPDKTWDAVIDIFTFRNIRQTYEEFKKKCSHFFILSSTLVYDRSKYSAERISSNHHKAALGSQGGYVDHKLRLEEFWESINDVNWTILRPYHIVGAGSYLGCLPPHNRDPNLITEMRKGELSLCDGGRVPLNIVNPKDIGTAILTSIGNPKTFNKAYNIINPLEVIARDYFLKIAEICELDVKIKNISGEEIWNSGDWKLTTLPHLYDISDLKRDIDFVPSIRLEESLKEAIISAPQPEKRENTAVYQRMHLLPKPQYHKYFQ